MPQLEIDSSNPVQNLNKLILGVIEIIKENILIGNSVNKSVTNTTTPCTSTNARLSKEWPDYHSISTCIVIHLRNYCAPRHLNNNGTSFSTTAIIINSLLSGHIHLSLEQSSLRLQYE